jgi:hypothetical protein
VAVVPSYKRYVPPVGREADAGVVIVAFEYCLALAGRYVVQVNIEIAFVPFVRFVNEFLRVAGKAAETEDRAVVVGNAA